MNGSDVAMYSFRETDTYPYNLSINHPLNGVMAMVTTASENPPGSRTFDITSVLIASDVSVLNGASLQCEITATFSNMLNVSVNSLCKLTHN